MPVSGPACFAGIGGATLNEGLHRIINGYVPSPSASPREILREMRGKFSPQTEFKRPMRICERGSQRNAAPFHSPVYGDFRDSGIRPVIYDG